MKAPLSILFGIISLVALLYGNTSTAIFFLILETALNWLVWIEYNKLLLKISAIISPKIDLSTERINQLEFKISELERRIEKTPHL